MDGYGLDLTDPKGDIDVRLPAEVMNISELVGGSVDLDEVEGDGRGAQNKLAGRVKLSTGEVTGCEGLGRWKIHNKANDEVHRHLANFVHWTMPGIPGNELVLKRWVLGEHPAEPKNFAILRPDENNEIFITYHCLPPEEYDHVGSPEVPKYNTPAMHFAHYYDLVENAPEPRLPRFGKPSWPYKPRRKKMVDRRDFDFEPDSTDGKTYQCMPASADPA
jgi:hypothetical protein